MNNGGLRGPLQFVSFDRIDNRSNLKFHENTFQSVLNKCGNRQIAILSICGPPRQGKSVILNFILRYLSAVQTDEEDTWMVEDDTAKVLNGFGCGTATQGMCVWSEPFFVKGGSGELAILLVDTQGINREDTSFLEGRAIFGLSMLTSAVCIYNVFHDMEEDKIENLSSSLEFILDATNLSSQNFASVFGKLFFLIREWSNPDVYPYGNNGAKTYLSSKFEVKPTQALRFQLARQYIQRKVTDLSGFLLTHPGEKAKLKMYDGSVEDLEVRFTRQISILIPTILRSISESRVNAFTTNATEALENFRRLSGLVNRHGEALKTMETLNLMSKHATVFTVDKIEKLCRDVVLGKLKEMITEPALAEEIFNSAKESFWKDHLKLSQSESNEAREIFLNLEAALMESLKANKRLAEQANLSKIKEAFQIYCLGMKTLLSDVKFPTEIQLQVEHQRLKQMANQFFLNACTKGTFFFVQCFESKLAENIAAEFCKSVNIRNARVSALQDKMTVVKANLYYSYCSEIEFCLQGSRILWNKVKCDHDALLNSAKLHFQTEFRDTDPVLFNRNLEQILCQINSKYEEHLQEFKVKEAKKLKAEWTLHLDDALDTYQDRMKSVFSRKSGGLTEKDIRKRHSKVVDYITSNKELEILEGDSVELRKYKTNIKDKMEDELHDFIMQFNNERAKRMSKADKSVRDVLRSYIENMQSAIENSRISRDLLKLKHREYEKAARQELKETIYPDDEENFWEFQTKLLERINAEFYVFEQSVVAMVENNEGARIKAVEEGKLLYNSTLQEKLQKSDYLSEEDIHIAHVESEQKVMGFYANITGDLPTVDDKHVIMLKNILCEGYTEAKSKAERDLKKHTAETEVILSEAAKLYEQAMNSSVPENEDHAKALHEEAKATAVAIFQSQCTIKDCRFLQPFMSQLTQITERYFNENIPKLLFERKRLELDVKESIIKCKKHYQETMDKRLVNFINPSDFFTLHEKTVLQAIQCCRKNYSNYENQKIRDALEFEFDIYMKKNNMNIDCKPAIGIDLGTTFTCVAVYKNGKVTVIPNEFGKNIIPSYVAFNADDEVIGQAGKDQAHENPTNTIFDAKRLIGRRFDEPEVQKDIINWPFKVVSEDNTPVFEVNGKIYHPEQIAAKILKHVKQIAEKFLKEKVENVVITVPAYFNDGQKQATRDAGEIAGLKVLKIMNEPTSAAVAYHLEHKDNKRRNVLIFDIGGGTFDVAVLSIQNGNIEVKSFGGDTHLGGEDFDDKLVEYCVTQFLNKTKINLSADKNSTDQTKRDSVSRTLRRLRNECEKRKIDLSFATSVKIVVDAIYQNGSETMDFNENLTRETFETLNMQQFKRTIEIVKRTLEEARMPKSEIDDVVLVGGSTRIPKIQELLTNFFEGKNLCSELNADEAVAIGAAIQAAILNGNREQQLLNIQLKDVTPLSLGIEVVGDIFSTIVPKNTKLPITKTETYWTQEFQTTVAINIYEGEEEVATNNHLLGKFILRGISPKRMEKINVTMEINEEGILHVTATSLSTGTSQDISIIEHKGRLTKKTIMRFLKEAEEDEE